MGTSSVSARKFARLRNWYAPTFPKRKFGVTVVTVPYRPEAHSGTIAGIGEYRVSFQYDPYLAAAVQPQLADAFIDNGGMNYLLLPQHLSFTFPNSYADADHRLWLVDLADGSERQRDN